MIIAFYTLGFQTSHQVNNWSCLKNFEGTSINQILINYPKVSYLKDKLNNYNIFSTEQFLNSTNTELLKQNNFYHNIKKISRGYCPKQFSMIQDLISASANLSNEQLQYNPYILNFWTLVKREQIITNKLIFEKIYYPHNKNQKT